MKTQREKLDTMLYFLESKGRLKKEKEYMQHGAASVYEHSVKVAYIRLCLAGKLNV